ncbi:hypothetical protein LguiB_019235 [Lonicera macranthoides]
MAPSLTTFTSFLSFFFLLHHISVHSLTRPSGFTTDLIHREYSALSPFYDPSHTKFDRFRNTIHSSFSRLSKLSSSQNTIQSQITPVPGAYLMNVSIGTPPFNILGIADTGSDLTWTQCPPCIQCFKQNSPLFDPKYSSTYKNVPCISRPCAAVRAATCSPNNYCGYKLSYGDNSFTQGDLAVDSFTFGSTSGQPITIPNVVFGCGHENGGTFKEFTSGIVGLGGGPLSIISQLKDSINGKFSYCLVPLDEQSKTSKINFGSNAAVSGTGVVSTPLITKSLSTFYYLNLEKITVGKQTLEFKASSNSRKEGDVEGNIIIDSGTTLTLLPSDLYSGLVSKVKESVNENPIKDPNGDFGLCYSIGDNGEVQNLNLPTIIFHFTGADVDLPAKQTFLEVEEGMVCLTIVPNDEIAIFGNLSQMNFLVGYDLVNKEVSFKRTDCTMQ